MPWPLHWLPTLATPIPDDLLDLLRLALAVAVTVHVLRTKRDVAAATGWIGLAWLAPLSGGLLYALFGINRVRRRAHSLRGRPADTDTPATAPAGAPGNHLAALDRAAWRITRRPRHPGNDVAILENGDAAYPAMHAAIECATESIALSTYIFANDIAGRPLLDALTAAHRRGVAVRVLVDGIGSGYFWSSAVRSLRHAGVPVAQFLHSPLPWRMPFLNLRTHTKLLVLDGKLAFTGGMNISRHNLVATHPPYPVRDLQFRLQGPVVAQLMEAFADDWEFVTDEELTGPAWFPSLAPAGDAVARVVTSGPDQDLEHIEFVMLQAISCAQEKIEIMTPYFLPADRLITALALAAMRGIDVNVLMPARGNHRVVDWAARANPGPLLTAGVTIWQNHPPFDHSKIMVVDGIWCFIGSANWDARSLRLNFELNVEILSADLASSLSALMTARRGPQLTQSILDARAAPAKLRDAGARLLLPYL